MKEKKEILKVHELTVSSPTRDIVRKVSFELYPNETLALVGESGSGKTMTAQSIVRLFRSPEVAITNGRILFLDEDLLLKSPKQMQKIRGKEISFVSQNPLNSLNPTLQVGTQLMECVQERAGKKELALSMLELVGFSDCQKRFSSYPQELSGGMRQRLLIAMALINRPKILIADEPTTALDVTIQAQILELLMDLQSKLGMSILFITHDMGVVARIAHRMAVMYAGQIMETGDVNTLFYSPRHPYTEALLSCLRQNHPIPGAPPQVGRLVGKCPFLPRCQYAMKICAEKEAELHLGVCGQRVRCHKEIAHAV